MLSWALHELFTTDHDMTMEMESTMNWRKGRDTPLLMKRIAIPHDLDLSLSSCVCDIELVSCEEFIADVF